MDNKPLTVTDAFWALPVRPLELLFIFHGIVYGLLAIFLHFGEPYHLLHSGGALRADAPAHIVGAGIILISLTRAWSIRRNRSSVRQIIAGLECAAWVWFLVLHLGAVPTADHVACLLAGALGNGVIQVRLSYRHAIQKKWGATVNGNFSGVGR